MKNPLPLVLLFTVCSFESFSQIPIAGLQVWFRADTLVTSNPLTGAISSWEESSSNQKVATQTTGSEQPVLVANAINGKPAVYFNAALDQYFTTNYTFPGSGKNFTFFIVTKCANPQSIISFYTSPGYIAYPFTDNGPSNGIIISSDGGTSGGLATGLTGIDYEIGTARYAGGNTTNGFQTYMDTVLVGQRTSDNSNLPGDFLYIGAYGGFTQYTTGYVAEIIIYNTALTNAQKTTVQKYLISKYNISLPYISVKTGNWNDPTVWNKGVAPTSSSDVVIANPVTVNTGTAACNGLYINTTGSLTIPSGDTLTLGTSGGAANVLNNAGTLTIAGTLNLNGNYVMDNNAGDLVMQTGGDFTLDGNSGTASTSVPDGYSLVNLTANANLANFNKNSTGGTITLVDPPYGATSNALNVPTNGSTGIFNNNVVVRLGNGISSTSGNNTNGFNLFGNWQFGSLTVNNPSGTNRLVTLTEPIGVYDSLIIDAGELRAAGFTVYINGPLVNNGTLTAYALQEASLVNTATAATLAQSISGTGIFRDFVSGADASTHTVYINNSSAQGTTLGVNNYQVQTLTLNAGLLALGTDTLDCVSAPTVTGSNSWINTNGTGSVEIQSVNNTNVVFPVGTASDYNPATINNSASIDNFFVSVGSTITDSLNDTPYVRRQWEIKESTPQSANMTLSLQWNSGDEGTSFSKTGAGIAHFDGSLWHGVMGTVTGSDPYQIQVPSLTPGYPFTVTDNAVVLPVSLLYFEAALVKTQSLLSWETSSELNNREFEVERSGDGDHFIALGAVAGHGTSSLPHSYQFTDPQPLPGLNYYRLKQVDLDGNSAFSKTVSLILGANQDLNLYPNPSGGRVTLKLPSRELGHSAMLVIYNGGGQSVRTVKIPSGQSVWNQDLSGLPSGVYLLQVIYEDNHLETLKFIKQ